MRSLARWLCFVLLLLAALPGRSQPWTDETHHLTMTPPERWNAMPGVVLNEARQSVRHVTGGGYLGGYQFNDARVLLFPYVLIQYTPYTTLDDNQRPTHQLDEFETLELIARLVPTLRAPDPLPEGMDLAAFTEQTRSATLSLARVDDGGGFELTGQIPFANGEGAITYYTVGRLGRSGVAYATVFTEEDIAALMPVAEHSLRTLAFTDGHGFTELPQDAPGVAGFLPPVAEPLPADALRLGDGVFGVVPQGAFVPLPAGAFGRDDPALLSAVPEALRAGLRFEKVFTRTPSSARITTPWAAAAFVPWEQWGLEASPPRRPGMSAWADVVAQAVGRAPGEVRDHLERYLAEELEFVPLFGPGGADDTQAWRLEQADPHRGRFVLVQRTPDPVDAQYTLRRVLTLQAGASGIALLATQGYDDAADAEWAVLTAMAESIRFVGGERLADLPPADGATHASPRDDQAPGDALPSAEGPQAGGGAGVQDETAEGPAEDGGDANAALALPLVIGGLVLVFVVIAAVVVVSSHRQAVRRRERARARRERLAEGGAMPTGEPQRGDTPDPRKRRR